MALKLNASAVYSLQLSDSPGQRPELGVSSFLHFIIELLCRPFKAHMHQRNTFKCVFLLNIQLCCRTQSCLWSFKPNRLYQNTTRISCSMNMAANQPGDPRKLSITHIVDKARSLWDSSPQPVKTFPWNKTLNHFIQLLVDLVLAVIRYLAIPVFAITSISEMSYCAHERKLYLIPLPFLIGVAVAGVLQNAALESSSYLKYAEVPWHLIGLVIFFALLKFPGPYYPYWGRIFIPHMANGAILRTLWFLFLWFRKPQKASETTTPIP